MKGNLITIVDTSLRVLIYQTSHSICDLVLRQLSKVMDRKGIIVHSKVKINLFFKRKWLRFQVTKFTETLHNDRKES